MALVDVWRRLVGEYVGLLRCTMPRCMYSRLLKKFLMAEKEEWLDTCVVNVFFQSWFYLQLWRLLNAGFGRWWVIICAISQCTFTICLNSPLKTYFQGSFLLQERCGSETLKRNDKWVFWSRKNDKSTNVSKVGKGNITQVIDHNSFTFKNGKLPVISRL